MVQKKLIEGQKNTYFCTFCEEKFVMTLANWRTHCLRHAAVKAAQRRIHQNYKIWKARGFK